MLAERAGDRSTVGNLLAYPEQTETVPRFCRQLVLGSWVVDHLSVRATTESLVCA